MALPPVELGAVQLTTDWVLALEVALTPVGTPGVVAFTVIVVVDDVVAR